MRDEEDDGNPAKTRTRNQRAAAAAAAQPLYVLHSPRIRASVSVAAAARIIIRIQKAFSPHPVFISSIHPLLLLLDASLLMLLLRCHVLLGVFVCTQIAIEDQLRTRNAYELIK